LTEQEFWNGEFAKLRKAWEAGSFPALIETVMLCRDYSHPLPDWTAQAILDRMTAEYWGNGAGGKRGRDGSLKGSEAARHRDFARYRMAARYLGREGLLPPPFNVRADGVPIQDWPQRDREIAVFKHVAQQLRTGPNSFAFGSWDRIEASYRKVSGAIERGGAAEYLVAGLGN
jgi:hypothetical protein